MQQPWLGLLVAGAGLVLLWTASRSMAWIDSSANTMTLAEVGTMAETLGQFRIVRWYADWGWKLLAAYVVVVAILATLVNFTSSLARTALWFPVVGPFAFFNLTDRSGKAAPRVLGALAMLVPAAVLAVVWVDLLVEPELDPSVEVPPELVEELDQEALANGESLPDADLGFDWRGFSGDEIGNGLWMSFGALAVVGAGAVVGTRSVKR